MFLCVLDPGVPLRSTPGFMLAAASRAQCFLFVLGPGVSLRSTPGFMLPPRFAGSELSPRDFRLFVQRAARLGTPVRIRLADYLFARFLLGPALGFLVAVAAEESAKCFRESLIKV